MKDPEFTDIARTVEAAPHRFRANQAAGLPMFRRIVCDQPVFRRLQRFAATSHGARQVLDRISTLLSIDFDRRYEYPQDTALATYLLALDSVDSPFTKTAASLTRPSPQLWWAARIAETISSRRTTLDSSYQQLRAEEPIPAPSDVSFLTPTPEIQLLSRALDQGLLQVPFADMPRRGAITVGAAVVTLPFPPDTHPAWLDTSDTLQAAACS